jgi:Prephenate dehydrogenase
MNIGIIGLGLIGGSLARAIINKTPHKVFGIDSSEDAMMKAALLNAFHEKLTEDKFKELDLLFVAVNPRAAAKIVSEAVPKLKSGAIVSDICGNKRGIVGAMREAQKIRPDLSYISTHPMAGREYSGISHSLPSLFEGASALLVPVKADIRETALVKNYISTSASGRSLSPTKTSTIK